MLNIEQAQNNLDFTKSKLADIRADLARKQAEYESAKEAHAKNVAANAGRQRYPKSLSAQRESLVRLKMEIEGLEGAKAISEENLAEAENNLRLAELYENQVTTYLQNEPVFMEMAEAVIAAANELNEKMSELTALVDEFVERSPNPVAIFKGLISDPSLAGLSLNKFLEGEIAEETGGENDSFIDDLATKYSEIAKRLPELESFEDSWVTFSDQLDSVSRQANTLVPQHVKYIPAQATPQPATTSQTAINLPRHARGGSEPDDDHPGSDKWFHRRRSLKQEKNVATPVGKT